MLIQAGLTFFPPQTSQTAIEINIREHPKESKHNGGGGCRVDHADLGPAMKAQTYSQKTTPNACNPGELQEFVGGRAREICNPFPPPPPSRSHRQTDIDTPDLKKKTNNNKNKPEIYPQNNKGNTKYGMHFRGFPSWETIPDGEGGGGGR